MCSCVCERDNDKRNKQKNNNKILFYLFFLILLCRACLFVCLFYHLSTMLHHPPSIHIFTLFPLYNWLPLIILRDPSPVPTFVGVNYDYYDVSAVFCVFSSSFLKEF